jgi:hypothetical protein
LPGVRRRIWSGAVNRALAQANVVVVIFQQAAQTCQGGTTIRSIIRTHTTSDEQNKGVFGVFGVFFRTHHRRRNKKKYNKHTINGTEAHTHQFLKMIQFM